MKYKLLLLILLLLETHQSFSQAFSPDNLILLRHNIGGSGGSKDPSNNGNLGMAIYLDEWDFSNPEYPKLIQTLKLPSTAKEGQPITMNGSISWEGYMTRSANKKLLIIPGYAATEGRNVNRQSSKSVPRAVATVNADKKVEMGGAIDNAFSEISYRSATAIDGSEFWLSGETVPRYNSGPYYVKKGATKGVNIGAAIPGSRIIRIFENTLYASLKTAMFQIGHSIPRTNDTLATIKLNHLNKEDYPMDAFDFYLANLSTDQASPHKVMYVMDAARTKGVRKYSYDGKLWIANGMVELPNAKAVEGKVEKDGSVSLYIICHTDNPLQGDSKVFLIKDGSGFMQEIKATPQLILNATGTHRQYRSIAFSPIN